MIIEAINKGNSLTLAGMKTIVFRVTNEGFYFSAAGLIPAAATNLPFSSFRFSERTPIFWEIEMLGYAKDTARLRVQCVDFEAGEAGFDPTRKMRKPVQALHFGPLASEPFKAQLSYYKTGALKDILRKDAVPKKTAFFPDPTAAVAISPTQVDFTFPILELTFANGGVKGTAELPGLVDPLPFRIINDHIVAEFDAIKAFFVRALKRQTIKVSSHLRFVDGEARLDVATSPQVKQINGDMLELFRGRAVRSLLNYEPVRTVDKSLFTPDDVFASLDDDALGKATLPHDGHELLAEILRHKTVRNARQLRFLAGELHQPGTKLRYVLSPNFGFVFLAAGQDGHHFILELLDSHATYVWSIPQDWETLDAQFRAVEREIAAISTLGRGQYRRTLHFEHEFWFIVHENAESGLLDGFPRWRNRLLEGLV
jgi:hypothetical protein